MSTELNDILANLTSPSKTDRVLVTRAYEFAKRGHEGHKRYSGEPYLTHLVAVGKTLAEMGMGPKTVSAGLLHDVIEDTPITAEEVLDAFGQEILFLVEGVTKLGSVRYHGTDRHNESLRKLFVATSEDIRVLIIKLIDRLHNMQTLQFVPEEKQARIARETLEIYVPVAHRLGMGRIRKELEDLAFPYVYPDEFKKVEELVKPHMKRALDNLEKARKTLQKKLAGEIKDFKTHCRVKGMYSLFRKLERRDWDVDKIYDLLAIRVILPNTEDCYHTLGIIHDLWRPMPRRMKDYIAFPKPNGYQSIHTTVITGDRTILEVQLRTDKMHREAEFGVASHLYYKQAQQGVKGAANQQRTWMTDLIPSLFRPFSWKRSTQKSDDRISRPREYNQDQIPNWIKEIADAHKNAADTGEFVSGLHEDFFSHRIFVFTPEGDVIDLPIGASPIDFAYAIHTDIGNHISGTKVNNKLVQLNTVLKNGDIVEITTKESSMPTRKWLDFTKTTLAQRSIRSALSESTAKSS